MPPRVRTRKGSHPVGEMIWSYGSNLYTPQALSRCPSAVRVGPAALHDHAIEFVGYSAGWGGGVATVIPAHGSQVDGELMIVRESDLARLDAYEGAPDVYQRIKVEVVATATDGAPYRVPCWTYRHTRGVSARRDPSAAYIARIAAGYGRLGFDLTPVIAAMGRANAARWTQTQLTWEREHATNRDPNPGPGPGRRSR